MNNLLLVLACKSTPAGAGWRVTQQRDMAFIAVIHGRRDEPFFQSVGEVEPRIVEDIRHRDQKCNLPRFGAAWRNPPTEVLNDEIAGPLVVSV